MTVKKMPSLRMKTHKRERKKRYDGEKNKRVKMRKKSTIRNNRRHKSKKKLLKSNRNTFKEYKNQIFNA